MSINNIINFKRLLSLTPVEVSAFIFGPRMTGKTSLLKTIKSAHYFDLLDPVLEHQYKGHPERFWEEISSIPEGAIIIVDEIQRVPVLLDYIQMGIDRRKQIFLLSGSSARKLKRGAANLLGGRALDLRLHPLTFKELDKQFSIERALTWGSLPIIATYLLNKKEKLAENLLKSYITTYLKEEIQAESLVRNLGDFNRFLEVAAQMNGQLIEFANISRECSVPMSTVKGFYSILEDTLVGSFLWPLDASERRKARPRFYFFDCGVIRALQHRLIDKPTPAELGFLFETWFINEVKRLNDYYEKDYRFSLWRKDHAEVDLIIERGKKIIAAFELKSSDNFGDLSNLRLFQSYFPKVPTYVVSLTTKKTRISKGFSVIPWQDAFKILF